jgi:hypothetical protein
MLLGPASSSVIAIVGANGSLACNTFIAREASAGTSGTIAATFVRALRPRRQVVSIDDITDPSEISGAHSQRAVGSSPLWLTVQTGKAVAVVVELASAVVRAVVLTKSTSSMSLLVPSYLSP